MLFIELNRLNLTHVFNALCCAMAEQEHGEDIPHAISSGAVDALIELMMLSIDRSEKPEALYQFLAHNSQYVEEKIAPFVETCKELILKRILNNSPTNCAKSNVMNMLLSIEGQTHLFWASYFLATRTRKMYRYYKWLESLALIEIDVVGQAPFQVNLTNIINKMSQEVAERVSRETNFVSQYNRKLEDLYIQRGLKLNRVDDKKKIAPIGS